MSSTTSPDRWLTRIPRLSPGMRPGAPALAATISLVLGLSIDSPAAKADQEMLELALSEQLEHHPAELLGLGRDDTTLDAVDSALAEVYHEFGLRPLWVTHEGPDRRAQRLAEVLRSATAEGLEPADYDVQLIDRLWNSTGPAELAELDIVLTRGLLAYVQDVGTGRLQSRKGAHAQFAKTPPIMSDPSEVIARALEAPDIGDYLDAQPPRHSRYASLREALAEYRELAATGGWPVVPEGPTIKPEMRDPRLPLIRERLARSGDLRPGAAALEIYDDELMNGVKRFQQRHGLEVDGIIGPGTLAALNVPVERKVRMIELNMERWRWKARDLGERFVLVDIAGFELEGVKQDHIEFEMPVIVGKHYHETPVFSDRIKYIEFNPYWNITPSIARHEMLPKLRKDPGYLAAHDIKLFSGWGADARELDPKSIDWGAVTPRTMGRYKLRQEPGPKNALGTVKFMFPNEFNVYLHDTPNHNLFDRSMRAFSHGCIRLSDPVAFASYVLGGARNGWEPDRIREIIESNKRTIVRLDEPLPVHLAYETVWVDIDGVIHFSTDIYGRDAKLEKALYGS